MKLRILGHTYTVEDSDSLMRTEGTWARVIIPSLTIQLDSTVATSLQYEGLLHEIVEILNHHLELNLEHQVITSLSESLFAVLSNNDLLLIPDQEDSTDEDHEQA